jgi:hypothetical protein
MLQVYFGHKHIFVNIPKINYKYENLTKMISQINTTQTAKSMLRHCNLPP